MCLKKRILFIQKVEDDLTRSMASSEPSARKPLKPTHQLCKHPPLFKIETTLPAYCGGETMAPADDAAAVPLLAPPTKAAGDKPPRRNMYALACATLASVTTILMGYSTFCHLISCLAATS